jgi:Right handed beta helix region
MSQLRRGTWAVVLVLLTMTCDGVASGRTFYLSAAGDDSRDGQTQSTAWRTLERARVAVVNREFQPGDSIRLRRGDVFRGQWGVGGAVLSGTAEAPVLLGAYGEGAPPIVDGDESDRPWRLVAGYSDIYEMQLDRYSAVLAYANGRPLPDAPVGVLHPGSNSADVAPYLAKLEPGQWGPRFTTDRIWYRSPDGPPKELLVLRHFLLTQSGSFFTLENISFRRGGATGLDFNASEHLMVHQTSVKDVIGLGIYLRIGNHYATVSGNAVSRTASDAIYLLKSDHVTVSNNRITDVVASVLGVTPKRERVAVGIEESNDTMIANNVATAADGGLDYYRSQRAEAHHNMFAKVGGSMGLHGTDYYIHDNVFLLDSDLRNPGGPSVNNLNGQGMAGGPIRVERNVFAGASVYGLLTSTAGVIFRRNVVTMQDRSRPFATLVPGASSSENCYWAPPFNGLEPLYVWAGTTYRGLGTYQEASGQDEGSRFSSLCGDEGQWKAWVGGLLGPVRQRN